MFRRLFTATSLALVALVLAAEFAASQTPRAATVHVRVEGKTQTIYGAAEPRVRAVATALGALEAASHRGEFYYHVARSPFGAYVDQIGRYPASGASGWAFKVNGASPPVAAENVTLRDGDRVLWYWATFGRSGGPPTLDFVVARTAMACRRPLPRGQACNYSRFHAFLVDDAGRKRAARDVTFVIDGRRIRARGGSFMTRRVWHVARVTKPGAVRSAVLRNDEPRA